jgi:energy-coupling factor transport system permease protein
MPGLETHTRGLIFDRLHPAAAFIFFAGILTVTMFSVHPLLLGLAFLGAVLFFICAAGGAALCKSLRGCALMALAVTATNPFFSRMGATQLFQIGRVTVTVEALLFGANTALMLVATLLWFRCFTSVFTSEKSLYLFGKAAPKLSLALSMALRFIPLFTLQIQKVRDARQLTGLYAATKRRDKFRAAAHVFYGVIAWSLENAVETATAMRARGYGLKGRTQFSLYRLHGRDTVFAAVSFFLLGLTLLGRAGGGAEIFFYPTVSANFDAPASCLSYAAFGLFCGLPFGMEMRERLKWKRSASKI